ncbi:Hypothetical predicted protein, partial [Olea europaea subsp. europaea]
GTRERPWVRERQRIILRDSHPACPYGQSASRRPGASDEQRHLWTGVASHARDLCVGAWPPEI